MSDPASRPPPASPPDPPRLAEATLTQRHYFSHLEMRISGELAGMRQRELQGWWCDGFIPDAFDVVGKRCRITGKAWMALGRERQELWDFVVHLGPARPREQIDRAAMLPPDDVTGWLSLDFETKFMKVDPFVAHPDGESAAR
jgi:hypothetical protein